MSRSSLETFISFESDKVQTVIQLRPSVRYGRLVEECTQVSPSILLDANKQALSLWRYQQFNIYTEEEAQEFAGLHLAKSRAWVINSDKVSNVALKDSLADFNNASIGRNLITVGSWWIAYLSGNDEFEKNSLSVDLLAEQTINLTATLIINRSGWDWKDRAFGTCYLIGLRESVAPPAS